MNSKFKIQNSKSFAKKSFGQNFLVDQNYVNKIISAVKPQKDETIIEIGAGRGALTEKILETGANVVAVELERDMIAVLKEKFGNNKNFKLIESDALKVDFEDLAKFKDQSSKTKIVANLPYYISTAILQKLIVERGVFSEMVLMFQREVVERITAQVGDSERGFLTVLVEAYLETEKLFDVPPNAFRPAPKVWSSIVRLTPRENLSIKDEEFFRELISAAFLQKRKTIFNNLKKKYSQEMAEKVLADCDVDTTRRSETISLDEWICLKNSFVENS